MQHWFFMRKGIVTELCTSLLDIYLHHFNCNIFATGIFISAHPHLNIISGRLWKLFVEPWRSVKAAAIVWCLATLSIPQRISTKKLREIIGMKCFKSSITEVVHAYKIWEWELQHFLYNGNITLTWTLHSQQELQQMSKYVP